jgi:hypothetical protein
MHSLSVNAGIERPDVVLVPVNIKLRLSAVGAVCLVLKTWNCLVDTVALKFSMA